MRPALGLARTAGRALALALLAPSAASAQAWLPPRGEGSLSIAYGYAYVKDHFFADGSRIDIGHIFSHSALLDAAYGVSDRVAITAGLPYVAARYGGDRPHQFPIDDGTFHSTLQDLRAEVRFQALRAPLALTTFAGLVVPSRNYEHFAHALPGRNMRGLTFGAALGRRLDPVLAKGYAQARYAFTVERRIEGRRPRRSNLSVELGYFVSPAVNVFALASLQRTHGGLEAPRDFARRWTAADYHQHDRIMRLDFLDLGGGVGFAATDRLQLFATAYNSVSGANGHAVHFGLSLGASVRFGAPVSPPPSSAEVTRAATRTEPAGPNRSCF